MHAGSSPALVTHIYRNLALWGVRVDSLMQASDCPEVDPRWAHEYVSLADPSGNLWHAGGTYSCVDQGSISG